MQVIKKTCVLLIFLTLASIDASAVEKLNVFEPVPFALDLTVVAYTIGYFAYCGFDFPVKDQPDRQG